MYTFGPGHEWLIKADYGTWGGLPVLAIGPKGGKIVGWGAGHKPIYASSPKAKKLAQLALDKKGGVKAVVDWLQSLDVPAVVGGIKGSVLVSKQAVGLIEQNFGVKPQSKTPSGSGVYVAVKFTPYLGKPITPQSPTASAHVQAEAASSPVDWPDFNALKLVKTGLGSGAHQVDLFEAPGGKKFVFKHSNTTISRAEEAASRLGQLVLGASHIPSAKHVKYKGKPGVLIEWVDGNEIKAQSNSKLDVQHASQYGLDLAKHQVLDWIIANHDAHAGNFIGQGATLAAIDKGQAWKFLGTDKLSLDYQPNEHTQVYQNFWQLWRGGALDSKLTRAALVSAVTSALDEVDKLSEDQFKAIVAPYVYAQKEWQESKGKSYPAAKVLKSMWSRVQSARSDFEQFLSKVMDEPVKLDGSSESESNWETMPAGDKPVDPSAPAPITGAAPAGWPQTKGKHTILNPGEPIDPGQKWWPGYPGPGFHVSLGYLGQEYGVKFLANKKVEVTFPSGTTQQFKSPNDAALACGVHGKGLDPNLTAQQLKAKGVAYNAKVFLGVKKFSHELAQAVTVPPQEMVESSVPGITAPEDTTVEQAMEAASTVAAVDAPADTPDPTPSKPNWETMPATLTEATIDFTLDQAPVATQISWIQAGSGSTIYATKMDDGDYAVNLPGEAISSSTGSLASALHGQEFQISIPNPTSGPTETPKPGPSAVALADLQTAKDKGVGAVDELLDSLPVGTLISYEYDGWDGIESYEATKSESGYWLEDNVNNEEVPGLNGALGVDLASKSATLLQVVLPGDPKSTPGMAYWAGVTAEPKPVDQAPSLEAMNAAPVGAAFVITDLKSGHKEVFYKLPGGDWFDAATSETDNSNDVLNEILGPSIKESSSHPNHTSVTVQHGGKVQGVFTGLAIVDTMLGGLGENLAHKTQPNGTTAFKVTGVGNGDAAFGSLVPQLNAVDKNIANSLKNVAMGAASGGFLTFTLDNDVLGKPYDYAVDIDSVGKMNTAIPTTEITGPSAAEVEAKLAQLAANKKKSEWVQATSPLTTEQRQVLGYLEAHKDFSWAGEKPWARYDADTGNLVMGTSELFDDSGLTDIPGITYEVINTPLGAAVSLPYDKLKQAVAPKPVTGPDGKEYPQGTTFKTHEVKTTAKTQLESHPNFKKWAENTQNPDWVTLKIAGTSEAQKSTIKAMVDGLEWHGHGGEPVVGGQNTMVFVPKSELGKVVKTETKVDAKIPKQPEPFSPGSLPVPGGTSQWSEPLRGKQGLASCPNTKLPRFGQPILLGKAGTFRDGQVMVRKVKDADGKVYHEIAGQIDGKLAPKGMKKSSVGFKSAATAQKIGHMTHGYDDETGTTVEGPGTFNDSDGWVGELSNGTKVEMHGKPTTFKGVFRVRIPEGEDITSVAKEAFGMLGLAKTKALVDPTADDEFLLKKWAVVRAHMGAYGYTLEHDSKSKEKDYLTHAWLDAKMEDLGARSDVNKSAAELMHQAETATFNQTFDGHISVVNDNDLEEFRQAGWKCSYRNDSNWQSLFHQISQGSGWASRKNKYMNGSATAGQSPHDDVISGGADSNFFRLKRGSWSVPGGAVAVQHPRAFARLDWRRYSNDAWGNSTSKGHGGMGGTQGRGTSLNMNSTEIIWQGGTHLSDLLCVVCAETLGRQQLLDALKQEGIFEVNSVPIEEFVLPSLDSFDDLPPSLRPGEEWR